MVLGHHQLQHERIVEDDADVDIGDGTAPTIWFLKSRDYSETGVKRISSDYRIDADGRLIVGNIPQTLVKTSGARAKATYR